MSQRIFYGTVSLLILISLFLLDVQIGRSFSQSEGRIAELLSRGSLLPLLFLAVLWRGVYELLAIARQKNARPHAVLAYLMVGLVFLAPWLSAAGWLGNGVAQREGLHWPLVFLMLTVVATCSLTVFRRDPYGSFQNVSATILIVSYLGFLGSFGLQIRSGLDRPAEQGAWLLLLTLIITKVSDIGAYFTGSAVGRHKLIPAVSPGKSVEGTIGGLLASALVAWLLAKCSVWCSATDSPGILDVLADATRAFGLTNAGDPITPELRAILFGLAVSAAGQIGDLIESCFKRDAGLKDSGHLIPRFGGVLDLIDSPLFALPVAWLLLTAVWAVI